MTDANDYIAHLARARALLEDVKRELVRAEHLGPDDLICDLANLATHLAWQCDAPDHRAILAALRPLRRARLELEAAGGVRS